MTLTRMRQYAGAVLILVVCALVVWLLFIYFTYGHLWVFATDKQVFSEQVETTTTTAPVIVLTQKPLPTPRPRPIPQPTESVEVHQSVEITRSSAAAPKKAVPAVIPTPDAEKHPGSSLSAKDRELFERIVEAECYRSWSIEGYFLIAQTVINQLDTGRYGKSIRSVLTRDNNYSVYSNGRYRRVAVSEKAKHAVALALAGEVPDGLAGKDVTRHTLFCTKKHLRNNPNGAHGRSKQVLRYANVIFFQEG